MSIYYVAKTGNDGNAGTSISSPWLTITHAMDTIAGSDVVYVRTGTYNERIVVFELDGTLSNPTTVMAYPGESPVIDGGSTLPNANYSSMITIWSNYVNISGFEVKNININGTYYGGTGIQGIGNYVNISGCTVHDSWSSGIYAASYSVIEDCIVYDCCLENYPHINQGNGSGISIPRTGNVYSTIRRCIVHDTWGEGISTFETDNITIENNIAYDNWSTNIYLSDTTNCVCQRNLVYQTKDMTGGSQCGILMGDETMTPESSNVTVAYNVVSGCSRNLYWWGSNGTNGMNNFFFYNNTLVNSIYYANVHFAPMDEPDIGVVFKNNIISQDISGGILPISLPNSSGKTFSNNLWTTTPSAYAQGSNDIIDDPEFISSSNFKLQSTSPAINVGTAVGFSTDFRGKPILGLPDMGAYEIDHTYYVATTGNNSNPGTEESPWLTVQHANDIVNLGDTVIIENGTYASSDYVFTSITTTGTENNYITYRARNKWGAIFDGGEESSFAFFLSEQASYIKFIDLVIRNFRDTGIMTNDINNPSHYITIQGCKIYDIGRYSTEIDNGLNGVYVGNKSSYWTITQNLIYNIGRTGPDTYWMNKDHAVYTAATASPENAAHHITTCYNIIWGCSGVAITMGSNNDLIANNIMAWTNENSRGGTNFISPDSNVADLTIANNIFYQPPVSNAYALYALGTIINWSVKNNMVYGGRMWEPSTYGANQIACMQGGNHGQTDCELPEVDPLFVYAVKP